MDTTTKLVHNIEAEQQLLGAILVDNTALARCDDILSAEHFYDPVHAEIYSIAKGLIEAGKIASPVTLKTILSEHPGLHQLGGVPYLARLAGASIAAFAVRDYAQVLVEAKEARDMQGHMERAYDLLSRSALDEARGQLEKAIFVEGGRGVGSEHIQSALLRAVQRLIEVRDLGAASGVSTGLAALDERLGGLFNTDLIILAGRPSMGKTSLGTSLALRVARSGSPAVIVSAEMSEEALTHRLLSEVSGVPYFDLRRPASLSDEDISAISDAAEQLRYLPLEIVNVHGQHVDRIMSQLRRLKRQYGSIGLVVVDYLQLLMGEGKTKADQVGYVSAGLKNVAKQLDVPVLALSQLSRQVESRDDKRPLLSDLRDSGNIEQDADVVIFCYREHYYLTRERPKGREQQVDWQADCDALKHRMELITAKQRMGPTGRDTIGCDIRLNSFWDLSTEMDDDQEEMDF